MHRQQYGSNGIRFFLLIEYIQPFFLTIFMHACFVACRMYPFGLLCDRICGRCRRTKPTTEFNGTNKTCKVCRSKTKRHEDRYRQTRKDKQIKKQKEEKGKSELLTLFACLNFAPDFVKIYKALSTHGISSVEKLREVSQICIHTHLYMHAHTRSGAGVSREQEQEQEQAHGQEQDQEQAQPE